MSTSKELKVGIRVDLKTGLSLFGIDEVNRLIEEGFSVASLQPGGAIMHKMGVEAGNVRLVFGGCEIKVILARDEQ
jgi:hypothetical protein